MTDIFFNGRFVPENTPVLTLEDRSFRFGDGIFETMLVANGKIYDAQAHLDRLRHGLDFFHLPLNTSGLLHNCEQLVARNGIEHGYVRIIVSRGASAPGSIGYLPRSSGTVLVIQSIVKPLPEFQRVDLWLTKQRAVNPAPCKTNSALHYAMAMLEAEGNNCENALILDHDGHVCETATGNIFWIKGDTLYTPSLDLPLVPGTVRKKILSFWQGARAEGRYKLDELRQAQEIFMTNIGGLVSAVKSIAPGDIAAREEKHTIVLRQLVLEDIARETEQ